jgi:molybdopterin-containing oxidoreductase family iron-sulfur binding subunit
LARWRFDAGYAKGRILKQEDVSSFSIRSKHDFVCAAADAFTNVYCKSKQALVHIYNIVTGSSIAVI